MLITKCLFKQNCVTIKSELGMKTLNIIKVLKYMIIMLTFSFSLWFLSGCENNDGPAEQAGEEIDEAINDTKRKIEDATD